MPCESSFLCNSEIYKANSISYMRGLSQHLLCLYYFAFANHHQYSYKHICIDLSTSEPATKGVWRVKVNNKIMIKTVTGIQRVWNLLTAQPANDSACQNAFHVMPWPTQQRWDLSQLSQASTLTCDEIPETSHIEVPGERIAWKEAGEKTDVVAEAFPA